MRTKMAEMRPGGKSHRVESPGLVTKGELLRVGGVFSGPCPFAASSVRALTLLPVSSSSALVGICVRALAWGGRLSGVCGPGLPWRTGRPGLLPRGSRLTRANRAGHLCKYFARRECQ